MRYILMNYMEEATWCAQTPEERAKGAAAYKAFVEALTQAGAYVGSQGLSAPSQATTVRVANGKTQVMDGPYADTKEQLGGIFTIEVPDLDAAISWAARCPAASFGVVAMASSSPSWQLGRGMSPPPRTRCRMRSHRRWRTGR
jgi:hypothetical protein